MLTIWDGIALVLPAAELDEVKRLIGQQQVEENQDLRDEYVALLEMSSSLQQQTEAWNQQHSLFQTPERSLVESDLRFLLSRLGLHQSSTSKQQQHTRDREAEQKLQKYIECAQSRRHRGRLDESWDGSIQSGSFGGSRPASRLSVSSSTSLQSSLDFAGVLPVDAVRSCLTGRHRSAVLDDDVRLQLQQALAAEHQQLLENIDHTQMCLTDDADAHAHAECAPPPLSALREYSVKLQARLQEEEAQQLHEQKLDRILQHPSVQQKGTKSRCSTPDIPTWQSQRRETLARRPDTAYEVEHAGHHNQIPALQRVSCDADAFESTDRADAAGMRSDDMQIARTSSYALSAATLQTEQQLMHHHSKTCHELVHEPVPPNKSKSRSQVQPSPRTRVLAAKAWT